jgi:hypothetical protein
MKYKFSLVNHLKALEFFIIFLFIVIGFWWYQANQNNLDDSLIDGLVVFVLISLLPVLYLHLEYYSYNKGTQLEIDPSEKKFTYTDKTGVIEIYSFDDLNKITVNMSPNMYRGSGFQILPFEQYHYAKIYTKSGKEIIITCLMARKVMDLVGSIRGVPVEKKKRIFASILMG